MQEKRYSTTTEGACKRCLIKYHKSLLVDFVGMAANANLKTLTNIQFMLGFGYLQISQVLDKVERIFEMSHVYRAVEIWHKRHAQEIIRVIGEIFRDTNVNSNDAYGVDDDDDDMTMLFLVRIYLTNGVIFYMYLMMNCLKWSWTTFTFPDRYKFFPWQSTQ